MNRRISNLLKDKNMNIRSWSQKASVPYATVHDLMSGKTPVGKARYGTLHSLALALDISTDEMADLFLPAAVDTFATFRDNLHHRLKAEGDEMFLIELLQSDDDGLTELELMYKMCLADYSCNKIGVPLCDKYDDIRGKKLAEPFYVGDSEMFEDRPEPIYEFRIHNIIEGDLYDAY